MKYRRFSLTLSMAYEITSCAKPRIPQQKSNNAEDKSLVVQNHSCLMSNLSLTHHSLAVGSENRWLRIPSLGHLVVKQLSEVILVVATLYIAPNIVSTLCVRSRACRGRQNKHNDHIVTTQRVRSKNTRNKKDPGSTYGNTTTIILASRCSIRYSFLSTVK
ncbi:hypothetical protein RhiirA1_453697 [Rhizophagus irregularis]|uniref:Uncharacterized protein n=1 Tax=Rhizophagus irregularis TaxID=588596 RepID=A0A2N0S6W5_9GLOM|nr:hypothetical protein RhiirA1_453697 [Rhizophagus irregularis]CAB4481468.1 unnamed protein product [Rhizophagus irregularis]